MNLLIKEFKKNLNGKMICFLVSMFFICQLTSICYVKLDYSNSNLKESIILEYQKELSGQLNDKKTEYLENEERFINETIAKRLDMEDQYLKGELSRAEYNTYLDDYNSCKDRQMEFQYIYKKWHSVKDKDIPWIVYDVYWEKLFNQRIVVLLQIICFIFLACNVMILETKNGFYPILFSTPFGRGTVLKCKILYATISSAIFSLLFSICNFCLYNNAYVLPQKNACVYNISLFSNVVSSLTLVQYYWFNEAIRIILATLLCTVIVLVCYYWKHSSAVFMSLCTAAILSEIAYMIFKFQYGLPMSEIFQANWILR